MFQAKVVEKIKIHVSLNNVFPKNLSVYQIMWKTVVESRAGSIWQHDRAAYGNIILLREMRFACWVTRTKIQTHTQYMQHLLLFPRYKWLRESALNVNVIRTLHVLLVASSCLILYNLLSFTDCKDV